MKKIRILPLLLTFIMLFSMFTFPACQEEVSTIKVMVEQGEHFQVVGDSIQEIEVGGDVSFSISIDEGYYYVSNDCGAEFKNNQLVLCDIKIPKTIRIEVKAYTYMVKLNEAEGLKIREGDEFVQKAVSQEVDYGTTAVFDIDIDPNYEYYNNTVNSADGNNQSAVYENGKLSVSNVCSDKEIFVQLRKTAASEQEMVTVKLMEDEGFTIQGDSEQEVKNGTDVEFNVVAKEGYYYVSNNCGAEYNVETGKLILKDVRADQEIHLVFKKLNSETKYYQNGVVETWTAEDAVIYSAKADTHYEFCGWYYTKDNEQVLYSYANNLKVPQKEAETITLEPQFIWGRNKQVITYHANGGKIYGSEDESVTYAFSHEIYLYPAAFGEWCFKTFYREGYAPIEYNTKPDGSGEAISLGSRIFSDENDVDLYLIWAEENQGSDFTYAYVEEGNKDAGIKLLSYTGLDVSVVIPAYIEGKPVKAIGDGCFKNQNIESVVITKNITTVENGAFANCTALQTLYMCDSVEIISDESFAGCSSLKNLRMIAVLPPVYADHLIGATVRRFEVLFNTRNDSITNVMFYGGSSTFQGIDGATLSEYFNVFMYRIINCAQNAYVSGPLMLELYSHFMKEKDVMVFMPEYSPQVYSTRLELPSWIAVEEFYDAFRYIDLRDYSNVFNAFYDIQHGSKEYVYVGKLQQIKDRKGLSYDMYDNTFDKYFTRGENFEVAKVTLVPNEDLAELDTLKQLTLNTINPLYNKYYKNKLTMYFAYHAFWEDGYEKTQHAGYETWLKENLQFSYISNYKDHMFATEYMSDSLSHLTREGAVLHSHVIAKELKQQMQTDGYVV